MPNPKFMWYELMTTDAKGAAAFYGQVVGWKTTAMGDAYTTFHVGAANGMAGMASLSAQAQAAGGKPGWMAYVGVPDVDDYAARLAKAGGTVHQPPSDIPGIGRFAPVSDPTGAAFILFKGSVEESPPTGAPGEAGYPGWFELMAGDGDKAWAFYSGLFGWSQTGVFPMGDMGDYRLWAFNAPAAPAGADAPTGADANGGMMTKMAGGPGPMWNIYFRVDGADAGAERVKAAGGVVANGPMQVPSGDWIVQGIDPQGAMFCLLSATK